jgi:hypothetical protein
VARGGGASAAQSTSQRRAEGSMPGPRRGRRASEAPLSNMNHNERAPYGHPAYEAGGR